jgi:hypothetical protein
MLPSETADVAITHPHVGRHFTMVRNLFWMLCAGMPIAAAVWLGSSWTDWDVPDRQALAESPASEVATAPASPSAPESVARSSAPSCCETACPDTTILALATSAVGSADDEPPAPAAKPAAAEPIADEAAPADSSVEDPASDDVSAANAMPDDSAESDLLSAVEADEAVADLARASKTAASRLGLMTPQREAQLRRFLPRVDDPAIAAVLADPDLMLYTEREMPRAYQFWDGAFPGVHSANYNISANGSEPFGNGNREFPWGTPAGTHRSKGVVSFRFMLLPRDEEGQPLPVVYFRQRGATDGAMGYSWTFPLGTVFGEVLTLADPSGRHHTFELRIRRRERGHWDVDVFRPYPTAASLAQRIKQLRPDWASQPKLAAAVKQLDEQPATLTKKTLADRQPGARTFASTMGVDELPDLGDDRLVAELLADATFHSALAQPWREAADGTLTFAPTTQASFQIVPASYDAGFVAVDSDSCMRCHETVNHSVRRFNSRRDWYGRVRGSDGIFSFHPFAPESISGNGFARPVSMRREFEKAGLIEPFNPKRHQNKVYHRLQGVRE